VIVEPAERWTGQIGALILRAAPGGRFLPRDGFDAQLSVASWLAPVMIPGSGRTAGDIRRDLDHAARIDERCIRCRSRSSPDGTADRLRKLAIEAMPPDR
jgi:hypothetical protein